MNHPPNPPSAWISRFIRRLPPASSVLDLACGTGRHTRLLTAAGHQVTAVDRDLSQLADFSPDPGSVQLVEVDLEDGSGWPLEDSRFDLIVVTNYLWRPLFPYLRTAVAKGGMLLYETFAVGNERFGKPDNPAFLLRPDELLAEFGTSLQVLAFEQGEVEAPKPAVVQRICAVHMDQGELPLRLPTG
ncbi:MAG: class I SAM-dependent methyltransferase [Pseudomonadota bacterium]|nr:class I SAM-dependent methyltransferase [Planctomycetota bacterium]MEE3214172.1 class I SAM-dependent methyltransferase [Pseudomonadota bacterium]